MRHQSNVTPVNPRCGENVLPPEFVVVLLIILNRPKLMYNIPLFMEYNMK